MALKDSSELVKMYAMVNVKQSTIVGTGYNLTECTENYAAELKRNGVNVDIDVDEMGRKGRPDRYRPRNRGNKRQDNRDKKRRNGRRKRTSI